MADLIEVAELDSGKREPQIERLHPYTELVQARDRINDDACHRGVRIDLKAFADLSFRSRQTGGPCTPSSITF